MRSDQTRLDKELKETDQLLMEKMAVLAQIEAKNKQLIEANQELETRLNQYLRQSGRAAVTPQPVTPTRAIVQPAPATARDIALNGRVTAVDMKNALAEISIGAAAGVKPSTFRINGIMFNGPDSMAIINDGVYRIGQKVSGAVIVNITPSSVVLEMYGKRFSVGM